MEALRVLSYGLVAAAVLSFGSALFLMASPPRPDCSGGGGVLCEEKAYDRLQGLVVLVGLLGVILLVAAVGVFVADLRRRGIAPPEAVAAADAPAPPGPAPKGAGVAFRRAAPQRPPAVAFTRTGAESPGKVSPRPPRRPGDGA